MHGLFAPKFGCFSFLRWLFASFALLFALPAGAEFKILFIGNSFTQGSGDSADRAASAGGVPGIFDRLAQAGGREDPMTAMRAVGGMDYEFHSKDAATRAAIRSQLWTHVVLQNYSTEPTHLVDGSHSLAEHFQYGRELSRQVLSNHPQTQIILYETWSRAAAHSLITGVSSPGGYASTDEMQSELRSNYHQLADSLSAEQPANPPVQVAPVGDAWQNAGGLLPASDPRFVDLYAGDNYHGNDNGYYLAAAVFYSQIYGRSPEGLGTNALVKSLNLNLTVDPAVLEAVAWATVGVPNQPAGFVLEPASQNIVEFRPATFTAAVTGTPPFAIQWLRDGQPIPGANRLTYVAPSVTRELDGALFAVSVSNRVNGILSSNAVLHVLADTNPPALVAAVCDDGFTLVLTFDEALHPATATDRANYRVNGEALAARTLDLRADGKTVAVTLQAPIRGSFTVQVSRLRDLVGNEIAAFTTMAGAVPDVDTQALLFDFGAVATPTGHGAPPDDPLHYWNNVTAIIGASPVGKLTNLVTRYNLPTRVGLVLLKRFNGANENGAPAAGIYPPDAARDSLYGNTEAFNGLTDIFPSFKLTGLNPELIYQFTFYASRTGVGDNRETEYTVQGANTGAGVLNTANNLTNKVTVDGIKPNAAREITIRLAPSIHNNNANHFTYLGVMEVQPTRPATQFRAALMGDDLVRLNWSGDWQLEWAPTVRGPWTMIVPAPNAPYSEPVLPGQQRFFRLNPGP